MVVFLLKSSVCLAIFLMFYKLLLEKERMHTFKRYYLLAALVLALIIPSITFVEYVDAAPASTFTYVTSDNAISAETIMPPSDETTAPLIEESQINYWPLVLWTVYGLGALLFALKFLFNLRKIAQNIRNNPKLKIDSITNVLLRDAVVPHTFLNYIFFHRATFEAHKIPKDVLAHEATHARQKHSLDILFVGLLQIAFWFNPLFHFAKRSIKLNHEFLADAAVLEQGSATSDYQNTLLAFASSASYKDRQPSMANAINYSSYSSIKKRFTVMKTQTSKKSILIRRILFLPLIAVLFLGFSKREKITQYFPDEEFSTTVSSVEADTSVRGADSGMMAEYRAFMANFESQKRKIIDMDRYKRITAIYELMTGKQRASVTDYHIIQVPDIDLPEVKPEIPSQKELDLWKNKKNCAIWIDGTVTENSFLIDKKPVDFFHFNSSFVYKNARSKRFPQSYQVHLYTEEGFTETFKKSNVNTYNQLGEKYIRERKHFIENKGVDYSELRILKTHVDRAYNQLSDEEIKAYQVQRAAPLPETDQTIHDLSGDVTIKQQNQQNQTRKENWRPTEKDFVRWKENEGSFALYIKGNLIKNSELNNYRPSDFYHFSMKSVPWEKRSEQFPQPYELHLYDIKEFEKLANTKMGEINVSVNKNKQILVNEKKCSIDELADRFDKLKKILEHEGKKGLITSFSIANETPTEFGRRVRKIIEEQSRIEENQENKVPNMDTIYSYKRLAERIKTIPRNQKANIIYLKEIYSKMDDSQKRQVDSPSKIIEKVQSQEKATPKMITKYNTLAKKYNAIPKENRNIPSGDLKDLEGIYRKMSEKQKIEAQQFPECPDSKTSHQEGATKKQMGEYNSLAKSYNEMLENDGNIRIKRSDVDRLEYLHGLMTDNQRADSEPFPDFPEPPEPPAAPSAPHLNDHQYAENKIEEIIEDQDPQDTSSNTFLSPPRNGKKNHFVKKDHSMIRTVEEIKENNQVIQETIPVERPLKTKRSRYINIDKETKIYLDRNEITYNEMRKMEEEGTITSINIIKKGNGKNTIVLNESNIQPPAPPRPKSPLELLEELKKENVKVIVDGKEIGHEAAKKLFQENIFSRVDVSKQEGRPVMELWSE